MRILPLLAAGLLATTAVAQTATQQIDIHPGQTSFTSRGSLSTGSGETLMGLHKSHWRGVGDNGTTCEVAGFNVIVQDQNSFTQENYNIVVRTGDDTNGPTAGTGAHLLLRAGPVFVPSTPTGSINAWGITSTLLTPLVIPCDDHISWGTEATDSPNWTMDGMSFHTTFGQPSTNNPFNYRNPNGDDMGWQIVGTAAAASHTSDNRTWRYGLRMASNTLQLGADSSTTAGRFRYGTAGMFPEPGRALGMRIFGNGTPNTNASPMLLGVGLSSAGIPLFPAVGRLWVAPLPGLILPIGTSNAAGDLTVQPLGTLPAGVTVAVPVFLQAAYVKGSGDMTNAHAAPILP